MHFFSFLHEPCSWLAGIHGQPCWVGAKGTWNAWSLCASTAASSGAGQSMLQAAGLGGDLEPQEILCFLVSIVRNLGQIMECDSPTL